MSDTIESKTGAIPIPAGKLALPAAGKNPAQAQRRRELDFLRGIAILLVLFRHSALLSSPLRMMGWIGVDLFFVLSGFLVSGLLFKEYTRFGNIQPKRFLIRRGFKIYPIYYLFYSLYLIKILSHHLSVTGLIADLTFTQNYVSGYGYAYPASWSLAVEEHFYILLCLFLWLGLKYKTINLQKTAGKSGLGQFEIILVCMISACAAFRLFSNIALVPHVTGKNITMTHLRIDSLLAGVLISYLYHFKKDQLVRLFQSGKYLLVALAIAGVCWTPFMDPDTSFFVRTAGFSLLYISFGILLIFFLLTPGINKQLNRLFTAPVANCVSKIGYCSYSIYIIHSFVFMSLDKFFSGHPQYFHPYLHFFLTLTISVALGMLMTYKIENYFLRIRDRYYPGRTS